MQRSTARGGDVHAAQDLVRTTLAEVYLRCDQIRRADDIDAYTRKALVDEFRSAWRRSAGLPPFTVLRLAATP